MGQAGERPVGELWVAAAGGEVPPRRLDVPSARLSDPRWAPDSRSVYFLSDAPGTAQLHRTDRTGGPVDQLTRWAGGLDGHLPLAEPGLVALIAPDEPSEEDRRRERERDDAQVRGRTPPARLRLLDTRTGRVATPAAPYGDRHVAEVAQRPGGGPLAVLTWSAPELDPGLLEPALHVLDPHTGAGRDLGPTPAAAGSPAGGRCGGGWPLAYL